MPQTVVHFERFAYLSIALGVLAYYNVFYQGIALHQGLDIFNIVAAAYLMLVALIFAAARRRQNWARWVYSVLMALGVAFDIFKVLKFRDVLGFDPVTLLDGASDIAAIASVCFAFSRPSNSWFRSSLSASEDRPR